MEQYETWKREVVDLSKGNFVKSESEQSVSKDDLVHFALYVKDKFSLSDAAYNA